ncbi:MAG: RagB/SusD family nutrient uptake outer membrane protein [Melioribacteraceae bacterium]
MKKIKLIVFTLLAVVFASCNDWVTDIPPTNDMITEAQMSTQVNVPFMITGLHNRLANLSNVWLEADGISDQLFFDLRAGNSTYPTYQELDVATSIQYNNSGSYNLIHLLRMNADSLVGRALYNIPFTNDAAGTAAKNSALYWGYLYGGIARYVLGAYIGIHQTVGGATINGSAFIPSADLYTQAIAKLKLALPYVPDAYSTRVINSIIGKIYFMAADYTNSLTYLNTGMVSGDKPFQSLYSATTSDNMYRVQAGETRQQWAVDNRFAAYIAAVPDEAKRIPLVTLSKSGWTYYRQAKYIQLPDGTTSPFVFMDWQETSLMIAEIMARQGTAGNMARINAIRTSRGMTTMVTKDLTLDDIYVERDKELFLRGTRLLDEHRFNKPHIAGMWFYIPISQNEIDKNPNLKL